MLAALTRTSTSRGPTVGPGTWAARRPLLPYFSTTNAFMSASLLCGDLAFLVVVDAGLPMALHVRSNGIAGRDLPQERFMCRSSPRTTEEQDIAVGVLELETTQTVISVLQWLGKLDIARRKFGRQCIRIRDVKVSVPAGPAFFDVSLVVRQWIYTNVLEHDHRGTPLDNAEEDVVRVGPLKRDFEPETVAIKRQRGGDILDDEERRHAGNFWSCHVYVLRRLPPNNKAHLTGRLQRRGVARKPVWRPRSGAAPGLAAISNMRVKIFIRVLLSCCSFKSLVVSKLSLSTPSL